jgi:hypothetical protein
MCAKAGIQSFKKLLDSRLRAHDGEPDLLTNSAKSLSVLIPCRSENKKCPVVKTPAATILLYTAAAIILYTAAATMFQYSKIKDSVYFEEKIFSQELRTKLRHTGKFYHFPSLEPR